MRHNYQKQISRLNRERTQLLEQRQQYGTVSRGKTSNSHIQQVKNRSRSNRNNHSLSRGKFACDPTHLKQLKRMLDGIIMINEDDILQIKQGLENFRQTHIQIRDDLKGTNQHSFSPGKQLKNINKSNNQKLLELKRFINMIIHKNQIQQRKTNSALKSLSSNQKKVMSAIKDISKQKKTQQQQLKHMSANSFYPSHDNSYVDQRQQKSKSKIDLGSKRSLQKPINQSQIQRLREENIRLQNWLNDQIKKNILLHKEINKLKKSNEDDGESIINRLKKDDKSLEQQNNILKSKIKNLEMQILNIQEGSSKLNHKDFNSEQFERELLEKDKIIKNLENDIQILKKHPMRETNFNTVNTQGLKRQIRYLQDRLKVAKNDGTVETLKRDIHRLKLQNQRLRSQINKHVDTDNSHHKMQKLLQQNDDLKSRLRTKDDYSSNNKNIQDRPNSQVTYHSPSVQNLFSVSRSYRVQKGHNRNQSDKFSVGYPRPRVQIDLHRC